MARKIGFFTTMAPVINVLAALVVLADTMEGPGRGSDSLAHLSEDLTGGERSYDQQAWRAVGASDNADIKTPDISDSWKPEEPQPDPPRRRRPGRKRKRRPNLPPPSAVDGGIAPPETSGPAQDGVRFNIEGGIQVSGPDNARPRQRKPQRVAEGDEKHWRGEAVNDNERPQRRRGQKRRQRPYMPDLGVETSPNGDQTFKVSSGMQVDTKARAKITVVDDDYKKAPSTEEANQPPSGGDKEQSKERNPSRGTDVLGPAEETSDGSGGQFTSPSGEEKPESNDADKEDSEVKSDKSYRRPYSQAKKQETDEKTMMGGSSDLKALLKQSGGLSLSEVLQQRNLSLADLLTGKQYALSALTTSTPRYDNGDFIPSPRVKSKDDDDDPEDSKIRIGENVNTYKPADDENNEEKPKRRLPPSNKQTKTSVNNLKIEREEVPRRRLPVSNGRRQKPQSTRKELEQRARETTTERNGFVPVNPRKSQSDNLIKRRIEEDTVTETTEIPSDEKNLIDTAETIQPTTTETSQTTTLKSEVRNRLSLKPRLRMPSIKTIPKRMLNPELRTRTEKPSRSRYNATENRLAKPTERTKKPAIPSQAFPISIKDLFGISDMLSAAKMITKAKEEAETTERIPSTMETVSSTTYRMVARTTSTTTTSTTTIKPTIKPMRGVSAKEEILEVLTDGKGGEKLTKILADRNMTLKELVDHRERGSSQVHLADIFHNTSREPNPAEPFLAKSLIEPISREIYPLNALLEGNTRETPTGKSVDGKPGSANPPPMFVDLSKSGEENLGIVTLFDKFSEFVGHPKVFDPKDVKKDSDGSSYFTSVINVKPTDEVYRESRSDIGFQNSHKQMSQIFSSIPTYIKTEEVVDAKVVQDWDTPRHEHNIYHPQEPYAGSIEITPDKHQPPIRIDQDMDGDGLIVLDDIQRVEQIDNHIPQASNQKYDDIIGEDDTYEDEDAEPGFYSKLPVGVRSAIIVSSAIVGSTMIVFLAIFVTCKIRQRRRNLLRYDESFNSGRVRSPILDGSRKANKHNSSSRSISPILLSAETVYKNRKLSTIDSQSQRDSQDYMWDSMRKPFQ